MEALAGRHASLERPYCDAVVSVHGVQFNVHRFILCSCSEFFRALFQHGPDRKEFMVLDLSAATMQLIIDFAYTGSVSVTEDNVHELLQGAKQLIIDGIEQICCNFLLERLTSENCIGIWQLSSFFFCTELQQKAYRYLVTNFEEVLSSDEFQQLSAQELSCILESDELNVRQEETVWHAILHWITYELVERYKHLAVLLSKVRLALTSYSFIDDLMKMRVVSSSAECMGIVHRAQRLKADISISKPTLSVCSNHPGRPRLPNTILFAIGGFSGSVKATQVTEVYDFQADRWKTMSYRLGPHCGGHGIVHCSGSVYCVGGSDSAFRANAVHRLDLATHTWLEVAPMHCGRCYVCVAALDGLVYAIGGSDQRFSVSFNSAECYDPQTDRWRFIAPMYEPRASASCTVLHSKIYICGGFNLQNLWLDTCECYCPEKNQWTNFAPMSCRRSEHGVVAYGGRIFAVGGRNENGSLKNVEAYRPRTKTWQALPPMLNPRNKMGTAVIGSKLFVVGGFSNNALTSSVQCYEISSNRWSKACQMEVPRYLLSCCVVSGLPNVAEYVISRNSLGRLGAVRPPPSVS